MVDEYEKVDDVKNLTPEERIKRLKEIEEKNKAEIEKAHQLIKDSEDEIELGEKLKQVEIPENKEVNVESLFGPEEDSLEQTVEREKIEIDEEAMRHQQQYLKQLPTGQIEDRAEYLQQTIQDSGYVTNEQRNEISNMYNEIREREDGLSKGTYKSASQNINEELSLTKKMLGSMYRR